VNEDRRMYRYDFVRMTTETIDDPAPPKYVAVLAVEQAVRIAVRAGLSATLIEGIVQSVLDEERPS
jgi:hypothetical protein